MTTTTGKAASNGSTENGKGNRLTGMARVRESEAWRTAAVMHDAAFEAERLCDEIYRTIYNAYQHDDDEDGTAVEVAATMGVQAKADEARRLLLTAADYLATLTGRGEPPPF